MSLSSGTKLGPYEIVSELGHGGMGVVYEARDPRLERHVAIKLLPPDLTRDETAKQRFLQEAKAASALDHPNICTIFEINETDDGQLYLVMAHYEGETLKERIEKGPLELDDAIDIATQIGQGLAEAHGAGIVHRDIKPANLFVTTSGVVKILDFGLAKLAGTEGVTQTGTTVGTVAYMSPEQARGQEVDHRTDIWSLGVVLYEMLAGTPPFQGENLLSIADAIRSGTPDPIGGPSSSLNPTLSRVMSKDVSQRYQSVMDLLGDLRTGSKAPSTAVTPSAEPDIPSIAVLPFANMSADAEQEYFCEGMAEEIINALTALEGLHVASRTSAFQAKAKDFDIAEIGTRLKVGAVLEGSVRRAGNRLRVTAQLINVSDGYHLWSERYDRDMDDVFAVQDEIAGSVVEKLKVKLLGDRETNIITKPTDNLEAYHLVLKGRHHLVRLTSLDSEKSLECFAQAIELAPLYAQAHAGFAMVQAFRVALNFASPQLMPQAKDAALKALALDGTVADAHAAMALVLHISDWDWPGAEREYRRALDLNPGDAFTTSNYVSFLTQQGRADEAIAEARSAVERDPLSPMVRHFLADVLYMAKQFEAAIEESNIGLGLDPHYYQFYWDLGWALAGLGKYEEAVAALKQAVTVAPSDPLSYYLHGWALGLAGYEAEAGQILKDLEQRRPQEHVSGFLMAHLSLGLGDHDQAIAWLQRGASDQDALMPWISAWPACDPLRSDPRFQALLQRMNLPTTHQPPPTA